MTAELCMHNRMRLLFHKGKPCTVTGKVRSWLARLLLYSPGEVIGSPLQMKNGVVVAHLAVGQTSWCQMTQVQILSVFVAPMQSQYKVKSALKVCKMQCADLITGAMFVLGSCMSSLMAKMFKLPISRRVGETLTFLDRVTFVGPDFSYTTIGIEFIYIQFTERHILLILVPMFQYD